ncbi:hypothetical protein C8J56DRAFT_1025734 [Mycena floridula]|nr:hypothetical protein C8J56DRAFT_1025734 [Mycena floridula]
MTYDFMDREVESHNIPFPLFSVAKLRSRFVECGVALAMQSGTLGGSFLVEEKIQGKFMKYVLNSRAVPIMRPGEQGAGDLLTDPQIMTLRQLAQDKDLLFGDGNIVEVFERFPGSRGPDTRFGRWLIAGARTHLVITTFCVISNPVHGSRHHGRWVTISPLNVGSAANGQAVVIWALPPSRLPA